MTRCELCNERPAAIFRPTIAICKPCKRDLDKMAELDNPCANLPQCPDCGACMERPVCADCWSIRLAKGSRKLATRG